MQSVDRARKTGSGGDRCGYGGSRGGVFDHTVMMSAQSHAVRVRVVGSTIAQPDHVMRFELTEVDHITTYAVNDGLTATLSTFDNSSTECCLSGA